MSERQTSTPFARSRASKKRSFVQKPLSPSQMRDRSIAHNKAVAQEQAQMMQSKTIPSEYYLDRVEIMADIREHRLWQFQQRGQFRGGVAV